MYEPPPVPEAEHQRWIYYRVVLPNAVAYAIDRSGMQHLFTSTNLQYYSAAGRWVCLDSQAKSKAIGLTDISANFEPSGSMEVFWKERLKNGEPPKPIDPGIAQAIIESTGAPPAETRKMLNADTERMELPADPLEVVSSLVVEMSKLLPPADRASLQPLVVRLIRVMAEYSAQRRADTTCDHA